MSLFPVGVWKISRSFAASNATSGILLLTPVVVGIVLLMFWLSARWLRGAGVNHSAASAALVTGTALSLPVFTGFLTPFPGQDTLLSAVLAGGVTTVGMGACMLLSRPTRRWRFGVVPGLVVVVAALLSLPFVAGYLHENSQEEQARDVISSSEERLAVLDHPAWVLRDAHEVQDGLRLTYQRPEDGLQVYVLTRSNPDIEQGCDFPDVECRSVDGSLLVHQSDGQLAELRTRLPEGVLAGVVLPQGHVEDPSTISESLRPEHPGERVTLTENLL